MHLYQTLAISNQYRAGTFSALRALKTRRKSYMIGEISKGCPVRYLFRKWARRVRDMFENIRVKWKEMKGGRPEIPAGAAEILRALGAAGFEAYLVGGCVRDLLTGRVPHDWDMTTSAKPSETEAVLRTAGFHTIGGNGRRFGTVIVVSHGENYEVTTYRSESYGKDSHRPESVAFASTLEEDLSRRDFTVNAIAMDADGTVIDPFGGRKDLERKKLVTVGDAETRFSEDALRLFRACRFLGQLDFMADKSLVRGMPAAFPRVAGLSLERVKSEVERLLVTPHAGRGLDLLVRTGLGDMSCRVRENGIDTPVAILPELSHLVDLPQMKQYHKYDAWYHTLAVVEASPADRLTRWAALLHDVGKGMPGVRRVEGGKITDYGHDNVGAEMAEALLDRWQFPRKDVRLITFLVANHMKFHYFANVETASVVKWVRRLAREKAFSTQDELADAVRRLTDVCNADIIGCGRPLSATEGHTAFGACMEDLVRAMPVTAKELHYDSRTPEALAGCEAAGMQNLLARVQSGGLPDTPDALFAAAVQFRKRHAHE